MKTGIFLKVMTKKVASNSIIGESASASSEPMDLLTEEPVVNEEENLDEINDGEVIDEEGTEGLTEDVNLDEAFTEGADGELLTEDGAIDGEFGTEAYNGEMYGGDMQGGEYFGEEGMMVDANSGVKDPILSNWAFVICIPVAALAVGIGLGILWAKLKIKKGIDPYED